VEEFRRKQLGTVGLFWRQRLGTGKPQYSIGFLPLPAGPRFFGGISCGTRGFSYLSFQTGKVGGKTGGFRGPDWIRIKKKNRGDKNREGHLSVIDKLSPLPLLRFGWEHRLFSSNCGERPNLPRRGLHAVVLAGAREDKPSPSMWGERSSTEQEGASSQRQLSHNPLVVFARPPIFAWGGGPFFHGSGGKGDSPILKPTVGGSNEIAVAT